MKRSAVVTEFLTWLSSQAVMLMADSGECYDTDNKETREFIVRRFAASRRPLPAQQKGPVYLVNESGHKGLPCDCACHHDREAWRVSSRGQLLKVCLWCCHDVGTSPFKVGEKIKVMPTRGQRQRGGSARPATVIACEGKRDPDDRIVWTPIVECCGTRKKERVPADRLLIPDMTEKLGGLAKIEKK